MKRLAALPLLGLALLSACTPGTPDTTPPTVTLTGSPLTQAGVVTYTANVSDASAVQRVEFYQGSTLIETDTTAPYTTSRFNVDLTAPTALTAKAYDEAGNVGVTSVTISQAAYQGQYAWYAFTDPTDIEASLVAEGISVFYGQTPTNSGDVLGLGEYGRFTPQPEQYGLAAIGLATDGGEQYLATQFFPDVEGEPSYLYAEDFDAQFTNVEGTPVFAGAAWFDPMSANSAQTYFLMVRVTADPFATVTATAKRRALEQARASVGNQLTAQRLAGVDRSAFQSAQAAFHSALGR